MSSLKNIIIGFLIILVVVFAATTFTANHKASQAQTEAQQLNSIKQNKQDAKEDWQDMITARKVVEEFIKGSFDYSSDSDDRYEKAKPFVTNNGLKSMNPSSSDGKFPKLNKDFKIVSSVNNLEAYVTPLNSTTARAIAIFDNDMLVNSTDSTSQVILKCKLVFNKEKHQYLVDSAEIISQQ